MDESDEPMNSGSLLNRALVVGCGYVGEPLADTLHKSGWEVVALTHSASSAKRLAAEKPYVARAVSVSDAEALAEFAESEEPFDLAIHCASSARGGGVESYEQVYRDGCRHLIEVIAPDVLIYTSSTSVYPHIDGEIVDENTLAAPTYPTSRVLRDAEKSVLDANGIVLRLAGLYGPERSVLLKRFLLGQASIEFREDPPSTPDGRWINQIHRDDVVSAILHVVNCREELRGEILNVSDSRPMTQRSIYRAMADRFEKPEPPTLVANTRNRKRGWTNKRVSNLKLESTNWQPRYPTFVDAMNHDPRLVSSIQRQIRVEVESASDSPIAQGDYSGLEELVFVFDKDGVLFNSEPIKLGAFESLFEEFADHFDEICTFNRSNVGAPRPDKLEHIFRHILEFSPEEVEHKVEEYLAKAADLVSTLLPSAPLMPGVSELVRNAPCAKYVCSNAPCEEVHEQLEHHDLISAFEEIYAHPHRKADVLVSLGQKFNKEIVFWGDTIRDYQAAVEAQNRGGTVHFVGVERYDKADVFVGLAVPVITDFTTGAGLDELANHKQKQSGKL